MTIAISKGRSVVVTVNAPTGYSLPALSGAANKVINFLATQKTAESSGSCSATPETYE